MQRHTGSPSERDLIELSESLQFQQSGGCLVFLEIKKDAEFLVQPAPIGVSSPVLMKDGCLYGRFYF